MSRSGLGIFGGTFNPIHFGHLRSALEVREELGLERVLMIPAAQPPLREQPETSAVFRAELVERAIAGEPGLVCDRRELEREGPSYTVDTLQELRAEHGPETPLCMVLGADTLDKLDAWHRWQEILDFAHLVVLTRPGWVLPADGEMGRWLSRHRVDAASLLQQPAGGVLSLALRQLPVSATEIRSLIAEGRSPRYLLPEAVWHRIMESGAYGAEPPAAAAESA
ncbi:MAG: nicotinate-nucleotide adenylyltransferase [Halieaceae bacterium]|nr:nicotinate-nucleotide adenylyltransferase [Halieaceae bacterium]